MSHRSRLFILGLTTLILAVPGFSQDRGDRPNRQQGNRPDISSEEWKQEQAQMINTKTMAFMEKMGNSVPGDKVAPVAQLVQQHLVGELKIRMQVMAARQKVEGDRQAMRNIMMNSRKKLEDLATKTNAQAGKLLEKKALRNFKNNLEALTPKPGGPGGRGGEGGGRGGRGGGGQGGGGGF